VILKYQEIEVYRVSKGSARTFKIELKVMIYTRRGQGVWIREEMLSVD